MQQRQLHLRHQRGAAAGLELDLAVAGMGLRSKRYSMIVENGVVKTLNIETEKGVNVSGAETIMQQLKG